MGEISDEIFVEVVSHQQLLDIEVIEVFHDANLLVQAFSSSGFYHELSCQLVGLERL